MAQTIPFDNSYTRLPDRFYARQSLVPVAQPELLLLNLRLAAELGLDARWLQSAEGVAVLAGNRVADGSEPVAQAYAGHQFGGFSPVLGDGRAVLLGELLDTGGDRRDIHLKGSGPTAFSRRGTDGRAPLGPVIREFIVSEAMYALGVPTTQALAAVATGETVRREVLMPGGVLARVAASHIRVGTFQYFYAQQDIEALRLLTEHAIARHYPDAEGPLGLLDGVMRRQIRLVAQWLGLGFIHGVMNTDNTTISGETIDYGPCAFMDSYQAQTVYSSIDRFGRYAYIRQPDVLGWNIAQLATSLLPLIDTDQDRAVEAAQGVMDGFAEAMRAAWLETFRAKLGLQSAEDGDHALINGLLDRMAEGAADFTNTFRALADGTARDQFLDPAAFDRWEVDWRARLAREPADDEVALAARLTAVNPAVIPRNHRVEQAIEAAVEGDLGPAERLIGVLARPYEDLAEADRAFSFPPKEDERVERTFCGT